MPPPHLCHPRVLPGVPVETVSQTVVEPPVSVAVAMPLLKSRCFSRETRNGLIAKPHAPNNVLIYMIYEGAFSHLVKDERNKASFSVPATFVLNRK